MIDAILDQMTLEEQVSLLSGADFWTTNAVTRLGVPKIKVTDGPNGARGGGSLVGGVKSACFPAAIGLGASWNPELVRAMGAALAQETKSKSARVLLAPTVNIQRSGLNGRNFECYSEDPMLTSALAVAYIEGVQSEGIAATIKHFAGNESEIERQTMSSDIDERSLREIYLPPFEAAVKQAKVQAVMSSYNKLNGTYTSEHLWLLTKVLREEWGFDGIVMSDWFGSHSTEATVNAGLDLEMPGPTRDRGAKLVAAVKNGTVKAETVRASARRMLLLLERVGAFEDASMAPEQAIDRPEHRALIRKLGVEGAVLMKNDGVLPLQKTALDRIAVIGPNSGEARVMGGGSAQINAHYRISPLEGIRAALKGGNSVTHAEGCRNNRLIPVFTGELDVEFFQGLDCSGPIIHRDKAVNGEFVWLDMPSPQLKSSNLSVRISGSFKPAESGLYSFGMTNAGLARLYIDGKLLVNGFDGWTPGDNFFGIGNSEQRASMSLAAGRAYEIRIDFRSPANAADGIALCALRFGIELPLAEAAMVEAVTRAAEADVALVFVGRQGEWDTEGLDLPDMRLPGRQEELIARVAAANKRTIVVLQTGGPVEMPWSADVAAILQMWYPGQELGNAVADVLFGEEPGGRLAQTFPRHLADNSAITADPLTYPGVNGHVKYAEGLYVGYRHHDRSAIAPAFPFGFGLSYTAFEWGEAKLSSAQMTNAGIEVEMPVKNIGARAGCELVQLYIRSVKPKLDRPEKDLRGFTKLHLASGQTGMASINLKLRDLAYFDVASGHFRADAGHYEVLIAANAQDIRHRSLITLAQDWVEG